MQQEQKCCLHCPGKWTLDSKESTDDHKCCLPTYVRGNLKLSSLKKKLHPIDNERIERLRGKVSNSKYENERPSSCFQRFAMAKKLHVDNLQHQPLPDRVDDSIFKNIPTTFSINDPQNGPQKQSSSLNIRENTRSSKSSGKRIKADLQYGPILGCKTPKTNMDLAICWEAPLDPTYEAQRAARIDGTEAGPAAAIFDFIDKKISHDDNYCGREKFSKNPLHAYETKFNSLKNQCRCSDEFSRISNIDDDESNDNENHREPREKCEKKCRSFDDINGAKELSKEIPHDDLCDDLESFHISKKIQGTRTNDESVAKRQKRQPLHLRHCIPCECRGERSARKPRQRLTQSAYAGTRNICRNGLPTKINVPRPKTPYAKRSYCIDTLKPPFSIVNGCRDADYPEHWRLTTVYQQSYRNPTKQRGTILNWD